jgi:hypothetical protein
MDKNRFEANELLKGSGDYNYRPSLVPFGVAVNNDFEVRSADLFRRAGDIIDTHEAAAFGNTAPLTKDDYAELCEAHKGIADGHMALALALKATDFAGNIQAISAHEAAGEAHRSASKIAEMMLDSEFPAEYNKLYPNMSSNSSRLGRNAAWDNEPKNWNSAHRAFVLSRQAYNNTVFDTGM